MGLYSTVHKLSTWQLVLKVDSFQKLILYLRNALVSFVIPPPKAVLKLQPEKWPGQLIKYRCQSQRSEAHCFTLGSKKQNF